MRNRIKEQLVPEDALKEEGSAPNPKQVETEEKETKQGSSEKTDGNV